MNENDHIRKLLADVKNGEKGWQKSFASAEGSYSRTLAQKNLRRLADLRVTLLDQLNALDSHPHSSIETPADHGMTGNNLDNAFSDRLIENI